MVNLEAANLVEESRKVVVEAEVSRPTKVQEEEEDKAVERTTEEKVRKPVDSLSQTMAAGLAPTASSTTATSRPRRGNASTVARSTTKLQRAPRRALERESLTLSNTTRTSRISSSISDNNSNISNNNNNQRLQHSRRQRPQRGVF